ncbi:hypothetical protein A2U01_0114965, partial [Trifolium medium]|nr:hypothetical protein [Trifolium medium]
MWATPRAAGAAPGA